MAGGVIHRRTPRPPRLMRTVVHGLRTAVIAPIFVLVTAFLALFVIGARQLGFAVLMHEA